MSWHLVAIDLQHVFGDPGSPWAAPRFAEILPRVRALVAAAPAVTFTRFVAPDEPTGAWVDYYRDWPFALVPPADPTYEIVDGVGHGPGSAVVTATTFGKWGPALAERVGADQMVLAGVSTDCCVLSTALAAADAGCPVIVVTDASAGADDATHAQALAAMALYAPLITLSTTAELLGRVRRRPRPGP